MPQSEENVDQQQSQFRDTLLQTTYDGFGIKDRNQFDWFGEHQGGLKAIEENQNAHITCVINQSQIPL